MLVHRNFCFYKKYTCTHMYCNSRYCQTVHLVLPCNSSFVFWSDMRIDKSTDFLKDQLGTKILNINFIHFSFFRSRPVPFFQSKPELVLSLVKKKSIQSTKKQDLKIWKKEFWIPYSLNIKPKKLHLSTLKQL